MAIQLMGARATEPSDISPSVVLDLLKKHVAPLSIKRLVEGKESDLFTCSPASLNLVLQEQKALLAEMLRTSRVFKFTTLLCAIREFFEYLQVQREANCARANAYGLKHCCMHIGVVARRSTTGTRLAPEVSELVAIWRKHEMGGCARSAPVVGKTARRLLRKRTSQSSGASPAKKASSGPPTSEELAAMYGRPSSSAGVDVVCVSSQEDTQPKASTGSQTPILVQEGKTFWHGQWGCSVLALEDGSVTPVPEPGEGKPPEAKMKRPAQAQAKAKAKAKAKVVVVPATGMPAQPVPATGTVLATYATKKSYLRMKKEETGKKHLLVAVTETQSRDHQHVVKQLYDKAQGESQQDFETLKLFLLSERARILG